MDNLIFQGWVRILIGTGLLLLWYFWARKKLWPVLRSKLEEPKVDGSAATKVKAEFPIFGLTGMVLLSLAFFWYANFELAYRDPTQKPNYSVEAERDRERKERLSKEFPVITTENETLEERAKRIKAESEAQNTKAKEDFKKLKSEEKKD